MDFEILDCIIHHTVHYDFCLVIVSLYVWVSISVPHANRNQAGFFSGFHSIQKLIYIDFNNQFWIGFGVCCCIGWNKYTYVLISSYFYTRNLDKSWSERDWKQKPKTSDKICSTLWMTTKIYDVFMIMYLVRCDLPVFCFSVFNASSIMLRAPKWKCKTNRQIVERSAAERRKKKWNAMRWFNVLGNNSDTYTRTLQRYRHKYQTLLWTMHGIHIYTQTSPIVSEWKGKPKCVTNYEIKSQRNRYYVTGEEEEIYHTK